MGIYLPNMEMPKEGDWITLRVFPDGQCVLYDWCGNDFNFMEHLTAVPVPPHGRLIDQDACRDEFMDGVYELCNDDPDNYRANAIIDLYDNAPPVIEAEEVYGQFTDTAGNYHWCGTHSGKHIVKV